MKYLNIEEVDISLTAIVDEIASTQSEIVLTRDGLPIARVVPCQNSSPSKGNYPLRGMPIAIAADFDEPMPELWEAMAE
ncbi:prevent-host-death family protein [[Phormidium ambiguum] IAM M-71]|uniref:Prevent-host-death family protein n=1 Tax=[Phormidium ambiguum] IAM M-71 TaxID=454136 RepID=A0A1U7IAA0_9CYAN|nr:prevent-host-death family protein [Phormidium ambiguum]OKH33492.1 prevent-host-death family protein [Phormidium ambiguum IAM M-71]